MNLLSLKLSLLSLSLSQSFSSLCVSLPLEQVTVLKPRYSRGNEGEGKVCSKVLVVPETVLTDIAEQKHLHPFPIHDSFCLRINVKSSNFHTMTCGSCLASERREG